LIEREILWRLAPHIIWPLRFVLPHHKGLRPAWLLRLGLFIYDHLGGRKLLPATRTLSLKRDPAGVPLKEAGGIAFEYSDCWVEDARLVVLNAMDARERGAIIETRHRLVSADRADGLWSLIIEDTRSGARKTISSCVLVNAAGPWVGDVLSVKVRSNTTAKVRLVQGSHIVVRKVFEHDRSYIFQNQDGRIIFAIPYESDFTLIGTTDRDYQGDPAKVVATDEEIAYLCAAASEYFAKPVQTSDVVWTYSGVRPLYDDGASKAQEATRDYVLTLDAPGDKTPLLSIFGGKITTYRRLAEAALEKLAPFFAPGIAEKKGWTAEARLPGGDFPQEEYDGLVSQLVRDHSGISRPLIARLVRAYGTRATDILKDAKSEQDLGTLFGSNLTQREVQYLIANEWAQTTEDVLWRRSKLGLKMSKSEVTVLDAYMQSEHLKIQRGVELGERTE